jgi:hypothetical protein
MQAENKIKKCKYCGKEISRNWFCSGSCFIKYIRYEIIQEIIDSIY